jgi:hypothetical protein
MPSRQPPGRRRYFQRPIAWSRSSERQCGYWRP